MTPEAAVLSKSKFSVLPIRHLKPKSSAFLAFIRLLQASSSISQLVFCPSPHKIRPWKVSAFEHSTNKGIVKLTSSFKSQASFAFSPSNRVLLFLYVYTYVVCLYIVKCGSNKKIYSSMWTTHEFSLVLVVFFIWKMNVISDIVTETWYVTGRMLNFTLNLLRIKMRSYLILSRQDISLYLNGNAYCYDLLTDESKI